LLLLLLLLLLLVVVVAMVVVVVALAVPATDEVAAWLDLCRKFYSGCCSK
jgi:hypothetical protein